MIHLIFVLELFQLLPTIISSSGKSIIIVAWKPMLVAAIQYSKNENQLNAAEGKRLIISDPQLESQDNCIDCVSISKFTHVMAINPMLDKEDQKTAGAKKRQVEETAFEEIGTLFRLFSTEISHFK